MKTLSSMLFFSTLLACFPPSEEEENGVESEPCIAPHSESCPTCRLFSEQVDASPSVTVVFDRRAYGDAPVWLGRTENAATDGPYEDVTYVGALWPSEHAESIGDGFWQTTLPLDAAIADDELVIAVGTQSCFSVLRRLEVSE